MIDSYDDAIHSDASVTITGDADIGIAAGDDGFSTLIENAITLAQIGIHARFRHFDAQPSAAQCQLEGRHVRAGGAAGGHIVRQIGQPGAVDGIGHGLILH